MKKLLITILLMSAIWSAQAQADNPNHSKIPESAVYNAAYVKALYAKYPTVKSTLCPACRLWVNPYYKSIADTVRHMPVCEYVVATSAHLQQQQAMNIPRTGIFAEWFKVGNDADVGPVYSFANKQIGKPLSIYEIVYGHCGLCWILSAWCKDGTFFSDAKDYNEGAEYQGQNIGTQIATEDTTRLLLGWKQKAVTDTVKIWAGCYGGTVSYNTKGTTVFVPAVYWKVLKFNGQTVCYWMPNDPAENRAMLAKRHISYAALVSRLGFDPQKILR